MTETEQQFAILSALASDPKTGSLTYADLTIVAYLGTRKGGANVTEISAAASPLSPATVSRALAKFLADELVWTKPDAYYRRRTNYSLTPSGRALNRRIAALFRNPPSPEDTDAAS